MADPAKVSAAATIDWDEESTHWLAVQVVAGTNVEGTVVIEIVEGTVVIEDCETSL